MNPLAPLVTRICFTLACAALLATGARAQTYSIEDGTAESAVGFGSASSNAGAIWLNSFATNPSFR